MKRGRWNEEDGTRKITTKTTTKTTITTTTTTTTIKTTTVTSTATMTATTTAITTAFSGGKAIFSSLSFFILGGVVRMSVVECREKVSAKRTQC